MALISGKSLPPPIARKQDQGKGNQRPTNSLADHAFITCSVRLRRWGHQVTLITDVSK
ncbi:MAG: hypothetical protein WAV05_15390 [Anaerolineales bacterium]